MQRAPAPSRWLTGRCEATGTDSDHPLFLLAAAGGAYLNLNFQWKQIPLPAW